MSEALRDWLHSDEVFVSWYINNEAAELVTVVGDADRLIESERLPLAPVEDLLRHFEREVQSIIAVDNMPDEKAGGQALPEIVQQLGANVVPRALRRIIKEPGRYRRLVAFPDGLLNGMPIELVLAAAVNRSTAEIFPAGVVTAPSASALVHCRRKRSTDLPQAAAIVIGGKDSDFEHEAIEVGRILSMRTTVVEHFDQLERTSERFGLLYVISHGQAPNTKRAPTEREPTETDWTIALPGKDLTADHFYNGTIRLAPGAVVVLSACSLGRVLPGPAHELLGFTNALFYAGAANVVAARWEILTEMATTVFAGTVEDHFNKQVSLAAALGTNRTNALSDPEIRAQIHGPHELPFFEGAFVLSGAG